jgi:hypothetical protein
VHTGPAKPEPVYNSRITERTNTGYPGEPRGPEVPRCMHILLDKRHPEPRESIMSAPLKDFGNFRTSKPLIASRMLRFSTLCSLLSVASWRLSWGCLVLGMKESAEGSSQSTTPCVAGPYGNLHKFCRSLEWREEGCCAYVGIGGGVKARVGRTKPISR